MGHRGRGRCGRHACNAVQVAETLDDTASGRHTLIPASNCKIQEGVDKRRPARRKCCSTLAKLWWKRVNGLAPAVPLDYCSPAKVTNSGDDQLQLMPKYVPKYVLLNRANSPRLGSDVWYDQRSTRASKVQSKSTKSCASVMLQVLCPFLSLPSSTLCHPPNEIR